MSGLVLPPPKEQGGKLLRGALFMPNIVPKIAPKITPSCHAETMRLESQVEYWGVDQSVRFVPKIAAKITPGYMKSLY